MRLSRNQKILVIVGLMAFLFLNSYQTSPSNIATLNTIPLISTPVLITITVKDSATQTAISGVTVIEYLGGQVAASGVTDNFGNVQMWAAFETTFTYVTYFNGYDSKSVSTIFYATGGTTLTILITKSSSPPPNTVYASIYCLDNQDHRVANVLVSSPLVTVSSDSNGLVKIPVIIGSNSISFSNANGPRAKYQMEWVPVQFNNYEKIISISYNSDWTAYVQQGTLVNSQPPAPPFDPSSWITQYWYIGLMVLVALMLLRR